MNLREAAKFTKMNIMAGNATIIKSNPGMGKTDMSHRLAQWYAGEWGDTARVGLATAFMATQSSVGATGLPWKGELKVKGIDGQDVTFTVTDPAIPLWYMATDLKTGERLPACCFDKVMLVLEEWGQGEREAKTAFAEVLLHGGTPPFYLPPGSARIALSNIDAKDAVTKEFDFVINRRDEITVTKDVDVWIEDFADRPYKFNGQEWTIMPVTKAWAKAKPEEFFSDKPAKQGSWSTPRSVTMWDRFAQVAARENGGKVPIENTGFVEASAGYIGMGAATSLFSHLQFLVELPSYEQVIADPADCPVPKKADLQMLMAYELAHRTKPDGLSAVIQYISRLPKDMSVTFVSAMLRRDYAGLINLPAMTAWVAKNASMVSIIASLASA
jgi:hypothetical protein